MLKLAVPGALAIAVLILSPGFAYADGPGSGFGKTQCGQAGTAGCVVTAGRNASSTGTAPRGQGSSGGTANSGCPPQPTNQGCQAAGLAVGGPAINPAAVAQLTRSLLVLPSPVIRSSPRPEDVQLVGLPTWLWVDRSSWGSRSATATVPGVSVTATATADRVTWSTGDGETVVCAGPGTPYAGGDPARQSPDCGHRYTTTSAGRPGDAFPVKATVSWTVTWTGPGGGGTLPPLTTAATAAFRVAESQALNQ